MKAKEIFLLVSAKLQDMGATKRWPWEPAADVLSLTDLFNSALRQIALNRPDSTALTESIKLQDGVKQILPDPLVHDGASKKALRLIEVIQNMGLDGTTPGEPIFLTAKDAMRAFDWLTTGTEIDNYAYDAKENPQVYWVYPGVTTGASVYVSMTYSAEPTAITSSEDDLTIPETFAGPIADWMLYSAMSGDSSAANFTKSQHHLSAFYQALGVKLKADLFYPKQIEVVGG
ncbi:MAG: hypothetical protein BA863_00920 [Desulfovibrio sp. S3730MH75]|nr:MAG: hypothetical protein BA863_00920 [Desulfovibrio sp. S3730MH75]